MSGMSHGETLSRISNKQFRLFSSREDGAVKYIQTPQVYLWKGSRDFAQLIFSAQNYETLKSDAKFIAKYNSSLIYVTYLGEFQSAGLTKTNTVFLCLARIDSELYLVAVLKKYQ